MKIHPTAVVDRDAVIGEDVEIGPGENPWRKKRGSTRLLGLRVRSLTIRAITMPTWSPILTASGRKIATHDALASD